MPDGKKKTEKRVRMMIVQNHRKTRNLDEDAEEIVEVREQVPLAVARAWLCLTQVVPWHCADVDAGLGPPPHHQPCEDRRARVHWGRCRRRRGRERALLVECP